MKTLRDCLSASFEGHANYNLGQRNYNCEFKSYPHTVAMSVAGPVYAEI